MLSVTAWSSEVKAIDRTQAFHLYKPARHAECDAFPFRDPPGLPQDNAQQD